MEWIRRKMSNKQFLTDHPIGQMMSHKSPSMRQVSEVRAALKTIDPSNTGELMFVLEEAFLVDWRRGLVAIQMWPCFACFPKDSRIIEYSELIRILSKLPPPAFNSLAETVISIKWPKEILCAVTRNLLVHLREGVDTSGADMFALVLKCLPRSVWIRPDKAAESFLIKGRSMDRRDPARFDAIMRRMGTLELWRSIRGGTSIKDEMPEAAAVEMLAVACPFRSPRQFSSPLDNA
jgi:hypothetical protein